MTQQMDTLVRLVELDTPFYCGRNGLAYRRWVRRRSSGVDWVKWFPENAYQCGPDSNFPLEQRFQENTV